MRERLRISDLAEVPVAPYRRVHLRVAEGPRWRLDLQPAFLRRADRQIAAPTEDLGACCVFSEVVGLEGFGATPGARSWAEPPATQGLA
jgi:hypothetical protein